MVRKQVMASSIGSRVAVVTGGTLFANQAKPSYIHQVEQD